MSGFLSPQERINNYLRIKGNFMYIKKIMALLITAVLILANLTACNNDSQEKESERRSNSTETQMEDNAEDTPAKLLARYEKANNDHDLQALIDCFDPQFIDFVKGFLGIVGDAAGVGVGGAIENMETMLPYLSRSLQDEYKQKDDIPTMKLKAISTTETGENRATVTYEETFIFADGTEETTERAMNVVRINDVWYILDFDFSHITDTESGQPPLDIPVNPEEDFGFRNVDGGVEITSYVGGATVNIPDKIAGNPVVSIGEEAFYAYNSPIKIVIIPDSVTNIGYKAFRNSNALTNVVIGNGVTNISEGAFTICNQLSSVTIGDSVVNIGSQAFSSTLLKSVTIPDSVAYIGTEAFKNCRELTSVTIGSGVVSISDGMFYECRALASITIPDNVTSIGNNAFMVLHTSTLGMFEGEGLTSITIPDSVTSIGDRAFSGTALTSITIPDNVMSMGDKVFKDCTVLKSVTIGNGVTNINAETFMDCNELTEVTISNSVTNIGDSAFFRCKKLTNIKIPDSVTSIGKKAFDGSGLTRITYRDTTYGNLDDFFEAFN